MQASPLQVNAHSKVHWRPPSPGSLILLSAITTRLNAVRRFAFDTNQRHAVAVHGADFEAKGAGFDGVTGFGDAAEAVGDETADGFGFEGFEFVAFDVEAVEEVGDGD